jgi:hypothetical protein
MAANGMSNFYLCSTIDTFGPPDLVNERNLTRELDKMRSQETANQMKGKYVLRIALSSTSVSCIIL